MFKKNYKIILFVFINLFFLNSISNSENVKNIIVIGNERISSETIIVFSDLENIKEINDDVINNSLKNLYKTNFFKDVSIELKNKELIISVKELPLIDTVSIKGIKAKKIKDTIYNELKLKSRSSYNKILLQLF